MKRKIAKIEWLDSKAASHEWEYYADLEELKPVICSTFGFIIKETKDYVTIAHTTSENQVLGRITIPRGCIKSQRIFR